MSENGDVIVHAVDVHKRYGSVEVLKGITLDVRRGQVVCLIGQSGSGKTTFLRCINHLETIDGGRIEVNGRLIGYRQVTRRASHHAQRAQRRQAACRDRLRLPALQPLAVPDGARQHHRGADPGARHSLRDEAVSTPMAAWSSGSPTSATCIPASSGPAAARRDRPRARDESGADAVRRADERPRPRNGLRRARRDVRSLRVRA